MVARDGVVMSSSKMAGDNREEEEGHDRHEEQEDDRTLDPLNQEPELENALSRDQHNRKEVGEGNPLGSQHNDSHEAKIRQIDFRGWGLYNHRNRDRYTLDRRTFALSRIQA